MHQVPTKMCIRDRIDGMEVHTDRHNTNDSKYANYGCNTHRHISAVYAEAKYNGNNDEQ